VAGDRKQSKKEADSSEPSTGDEEEEEDGWESGKWIGDTYSRLDATETRRAAVENLLLSLTLLCFNAAPDDEDEGNPRLHE